MWESVVDLFWGVCVCVCVGGGAGSVCGQRRYAFVPDQS